MWEVESCSCNNTEQVFELSIMSNISSSSYVDTDTATLHNSSADTAQLLQLS